MKLYQFGIVAVIVGFALLILTTTTWAADITDALYRFTFRVSNSGAAVTDIAAPLPQSAAILIDNDFIASDALNSAVRYGSTDVPAMPGSNRLAMLGAVASSTLLLDETAEANSQTSTDMTLVTTSAAVGQAYLFGLHTPGRVLTVNVGQAGVGTWTMAWEYTSATNTWTGLSNVTDNTTGFQEADTSTVSWDMPTDWATSTQSGITAYWARARISAFTTSTVAALGTRAYYETGQWWTYVDTLSTNTDRIYTLYLGGPTDMVTSHQMFIGDDGITTTDAANLELGTSLWQIVLDGYVDMRETGEYLLEKEAAVTISVSTTDSIAATVTDGTFTRTLEVAGVTSGERTVTLYHDTQYVLDVDGTTTSASNLVSGVNNTSTAWEWAKGGSFVYVNSITMRQATSTQTTFSVDPLVDSDNAQAFHSGVAYPPPGNENSSFPALGAGRRLAGGVNYWIEMSGARWDTSALPDSATITHASTSLYLAGAQAHPSVDARSWVAEWYDASNWPFDTGDYATTSNDDAFGGKLIIAYTNGAYNDDALTGVDEISLTGYTGLRFHVDGGQPTGENYIWFQENDTPFPPLLIVAYHLGFGTYGSTTLQYILTTTPALTITDVSGNGHDGNFTWPAQPTGINVTALAFASTRSPQDIVFGEGAPEIASAVSTPPAMYATGTGSSLPFGPLINSVFGAAGTTGIPVRAFWVTIAATTIIAVGLGTVLATGTVTYAAIMMGVLLLAWTQIGGGILPLWTFFVYVPMAALIVTMRAKVAV